MSTEQCECLKFPSPGKTDRLEYEDDGGSDDIFDDDDDDDGDDDDDDNCRPLRPSSSCRPSRSAGEATLRWFPGVSQGTGHIIIIIIIIIITTTI